MMRFLMVSISALCFVMPLEGVEFLGVDLCEDHMATSIVLPDASPLSVVSVEVGKYGALVILLEGDRKEALGQVDDLMTEVTGARGVGDDTSLQWSGRNLTAFAEVVKKGTVALAVSASGPCDEGPPAVDTSGKSEGPVSSGTDHPTGEQSDAADASAAYGSAQTTPAPVVVGAVVEEVSDSEPAPDVESFSVRGDIVHMNAADTWVDVMGVVVNNSGEGYRLATFDLSFYDGSDGLICVDTISVSVLKDGQERAFRDSIQCPSYSDSQVERIELQFAGGY